jgi:hypothetical protein
MDLSLRTETFGNDDQSWLGSLHGVEATESVTLDVSTFTAGVHYDVLGGWFKSGIPLGKITATGKYGPYAGRTNEVQTVTITGAPGGGTFTLTYGGQTTAGIAYNAPASAVQSALVALTSLEPGDVTVTGVAGGPYSVTFGGNLAGEDVAALTASGAGLTGGTSPGVTIGTATGGGAVASDGTETLAGFLWSAVSCPSVNTTDVSGAMLTHGKVRTAKLPVAVDSAGQADVAGSIRFI